MRFSALLLSALVLSAGVSVAQTGFSTKAYPDVLPITSDNNHLLTADLNGDGRPDLVSYGSRTGNGTVPGNVFINNGSGGFLAPVPLPGSGLLAAAAIGDMNGDGYPDIVGCQDTGTGQNSSFNLIVYLNNGNGTFAPNSVNGGIVTQCSGLTLGDVYHNGHLDVVTAGHITGYPTGHGGYNSGPENFVYVFKNDGTGKLTPSGGVVPNLDAPNSGSSYTNCGAVDVTGADFLQDGRFDPIVTTQCGLGQSIPGGSGSGTAFFAPEDPNPSTNQPLVRSSV